MFLQFINALTLEIQHNLPGWDAQRKMISGRPDLDMETIQKRNPKQSSVMIWLYPKDEKIYTRLILRGEYKGVHSAQVAFPGGTKDDTDTDLWHTALREAHEEVGLIPEQVKYVGQLSPIYIPPSNFWVQPYIGMSEHDMPVTIQQGEVQKCFDVNINSLLDDTIKEEKIMTRSNLNAPIKTPYYNLDGHTVWGATAMMLSELEEVLRRMQGNLKT